MRISKPTAIPSCKRGFDPTINFSYFFDGGAPSLVALPDGFMGWRIESSKGKVQKVGNRCIDGSYICVPQLDYEHPNICLDADSINAALVRFQVWQTSYAKLLRAVAGDDAWVGVAYKKDFNFLPMSNVDKKHIFGWASAGFYAYRRKR
jgi:hypothetical protein